MDTGELTIGRRKVGVERHRCIQQGDDLERRLHFIRVRHTRLDRDGAQIKIMGLRILGQRAFDAGQFRWRDDRLEPVGDSV